MLKRILLLTCIIATQTIFAVTVPSKINFAGMKLSLNSAARSKIQKDVDRLTKSKTYLNEVVRKADIFFPVIEEVFRSKNFPDDIKYLIIQESGFRADAVSSSNAVGFWQFKKPTAIEVGLRVDGTIDERKNIVASSQGAANYIILNNKKLNNWVYALTAYNTGLGGVQKYVNKKYIGAKKMDITGKTHWYFLKFLAHKIAYESFVGKNKSPKTQLKIITAKKGSSLFKISKKHGVRAEELVHYNKWIKLKKAIPGDKTYYVAVPVSGIISHPKIKPFPEETAKKDETPTKKHPHHKKNTHHKKEQRSPFNDNNYSPTYVTINGRKGIKAYEGDNLNKLAIYGGISRDKLAKYNEVGIYHQIRPGLVYFLKKKKKTAISSYHIVKEDESLWSISQKYCIKIKALRKLNLMRSNEALEVGRKLYLKNTRPEGDPEIIKPKQPIKKVRITTPQRPKKNNSNTSTVTHTVQAGETLWRISQKYGVPVDQIKKLNNKTSNELSLGEIIIIKK